MGQDDEIRQGAHSGADASGDAFRQLLTADRRTERALLWREMFALGVVLAIVLARLQFGA
jgi:hypothetical protein